VSAKAVAHIYRWRFVVPVGSRTSKFDLNQYIVAVSTNMSEFWIRKMKTHFRRIDADNDGVLTHNDYLQMVDNFAKTGNVNEAQIKKMGEMLNAVRHHSGRRPSKT